MRHGIKVFKFGGTSVGTADRMDEVAALCREHAAHGAIVVVSSAMAGVTDRLVALIEMAQAGAADEIADAVTALREFHESALASLGSRIELEAEFNTLARLHDSLLQLLTAAAHLGEVTPRAHDRIACAGEKMAVRILSVAFRRSGLACVSFDADTFLETDGRFGSANPLEGVAHRTIRSALMPSIEGSVIPIVTGFCGRAPDGATTTLGRGGSDLSATTIGAALAADEVVLWSDVDGVFTADPRVVPDARPIPHLNFREAAEMSFYGAKVLHQRTMVPIADRGIPVFARNTFNPVAPGTRIDGHFTLGSHPVKACTAVTDQSIISVEGKGMAGVPGIAGRIFSALAGAEINITMISQSSSEASITFAVTSSEGSRAELALKKELSGELARRVVEEIVVLGAVSLVAAVGLGMANSPGISGRLFGALADAQVNVLAIAQGSSELNISFAVGHEEVEKAVQAVHEEFGLNRIDTGVEVGRHFDVLLFGCGQIGRRLLKVLRERRRHIQERFGLQARVVAIADRSGYILEPVGLDDEAVDGIIVSKASGQRLAELDRGRSGTALDMVRNALKYRLARPVVVDVSNDASAAEIFVEAFTQGADVVTANKAPLAGTLKEYIRVAEWANGSRLLKAEATVGAGLPVVETVLMLKATGDNVLFIEGCFSGTLGFVLGRLEEGALFSEAVKEAVEQGYTEPDPAVDLSGVDVGRKAVILGRISGLARHDAFPQIEGLIPEEWSGMAKEALLERLSSLDGEYAKSAKDAANRGECLRFVAQVRPGSVLVGLRSVPKASPLGGLSGTDNMVVLRTERYAERPLVVSGPGAGVEVTAMGVLGDILRIAAERG